MILLPEHLANIYELSHRFLTTSSGFPPITTKESVFCVIISAVLEVKAGEYRSYQCGRQIWHKLGHEVLDLAVPPFLLFLNSKNELKPITLATSPSLFIGVSSCLLFVFFSAISFLSRHRMSTVMINAMTKMAVSDTVRWLHATLRAPMLFTYIQKYYDICCPVLFYTFLPEIIRPILSFVLTVRRTDCGWTTLGFFNLIDLALHCLSPVCSACWSLWRIYTRRSECIWRTSWFYVSFLDCQAQSVAF